MFAKTQFWNTSVAHSSSSGFLQPLPGAANTTIVLSFQIVIKQSVYSKGPAVILHLSLLFGVQFPLVWHFTMLRRKGQAQLKMESFCCQSHWTGWGQAKRDLEFSWVHYSCRSCMNQAWREVGLSFGWCPGKLYTSADQSGVTDLCHE